MALVGDGPDSFTKKNRKRSMRVHYHIANLALLILLNGIKLVTIQVHNGKDRWIETFDKQYCSPLFLNFTCDVPFFSFS